MSAEDQRSESKHLRQAERAVNRAFSTGKADRAHITRQAQLDAAEAVAMAGIAMESDEKADEAARLLVIASSMGNREKAKAAREREREARKQAKVDHKAATRSARQAYEAVKYSDPNSLGFLRVVQFAFLLHIVGTLIALLLTSRDTVVYSFSTIVNWVMVVLESVAFYFFVNRYKLGRPLTIAISVVGVVANLLASIASGYFSVLGFLYSSAFYIFLGLYSTFSRRVRASLVNDLSQDKGAVDDDELVIDRKGWPFYRNLIIYFVVFSVLGHWMEAAYCQLIRLGIAPGEFHPENTMLWRDWFYPYPMHGTAVVLMALVLYPLLQWFKKKLPNRFLAYLASYGANVLTVTIIELVGGLMFNAQLQNWDYSNMPFNFMGQVCLTNSLLFGAAASIIAWWVYPMCERLIARVRPATMNIVCIVVAAVGGILFSLYAIAPPEGIDFGANSSQEAERQLNEEIQSTRSAATSIREDIASFNASVGSSFYLTQEERNKLMEHVDKLNAEAEALQQDVDTLGDIRNQV